MPRRKTRSRRSRQSPDPVRSVLLHEELTERPKLLCGSTRVTVVCSSASASHSCSRLAPSWPRTVEPAHLPQVSAAHTDKTRQEKQHKHHRAEPDSTAALQSSCPSSLRSICLPLPHATLGACSSHLSATARRAWAVLSVSTIASRCLECGARWSRDSAMVVAAGATIAPFTP